MNTTHRSISDTFAQLRERRQVAFMPFIPAGYPDLETTRQILPALERGGANLIEIGIPFSDPIADGPTIQQAFSAALADKLKVAEVFQTIAAARKQVSIPLVAMVSYSIVYRYGLDRFLTDATTAGFNGLILPDLPPPEAEAICQKVRAAGLDTILLVAPTTAPQRRPEIVRLCSGFVYYMSISGITGARDTLPPDIEQNVRQLRQMTQTPVCVGFGVSQPQHVAQLASFADGAIVGSAIVRQIMQHQAEGPAAVAKAVESYCRELLTQVR